MQFPEYAYIPGQNQRHAEDAFDDIKSSVSSNLSTDELAQSSAFRHGVFYLERGFYWEAHEVLEPIWLNLPPDSDEKQFVQGLIQTANACLKVRMQRPKAAMRLCVISRGLLTTCGANTLMGVKPVDFLSIIDGLERQINCANKSTK